MRVLTLHVEESPDGLTCFAKIADFLDAAATQVFNEPQMAHDYVANLAERARLIESHYHMVVKERK